MNLDVTAQRLGDRTLVALRGELDLSTAPEAESALLEIEQGTTLDPIVLDLRQLAFMDSTGLRFILAAHARSREQHRRFVVLRGPQNVHRVFTLALLEDRIEFADSADALGSSDG